MGMLSATVAAAVVEAVAISSTTNLPHTTSFTSTALAPWQSTCLYSPRSGVNGDCNRPGDPGSVEYLNPYDTVLYPNNILPANATLASLCSSLFLSGESVFYATASISTYTQSAYTYPQANDPSSSMGTVPAATDAFYPSSWSFTASSPCCLDCTLFGRSVQVYAWPTPAPTPHVTALVNKDGFTFISPTIYVAFESLYATDYCGPVASVYLTPHILAFNPSELSTAIAWNYNKHLYIRPLIMQNTFTQANWGTLTGCQNITSTVWSLDAGGYTSFSDEAAATSALQIVFGRDTTAKPLAYEYVITYSPCSPTLSIPTQMFSINEFWRTCRPGMDALYDPPSVLTPATGLLSIITASYASSTSSTSLVAQEDTTTSSTPAVKPAPAPTPVTVAPTTSPTSTMPIPKPSPDPPAIPNQATSSVSTVLVPVPSPEAPVNSFMSSSTATVIAAHDPDPAASPATSSTSSVTTSMSPGGVTYAIGSQTLVAGSSAITISGTTLSLEGSGTIVVGSETMAISGATTTGGLGGIILSVGGFEVPISIVTATMSSPAPFSGTEYTSASSRNRNHGNGLVWGALVLLVLPAVALMIIF